MLDIIMNLISQLCWYRKVHPSFIKTY